MAKKSAVNEADRLKRRMRRTLKVKRCEFGECRYSLGYTPDGGTEEVIAWFVHRNIADMVKESIVRTLTAEFMETLKAMARRSGRVDERRN